MTIKYQLPPFNLEEIDAVGPRGRDLALEMIWLAVLEVQQLEEESQAERERDDRLLLGSVGG